MYIITDGVKITRYLIVTEGVKITRQLILPENLIRACNCFNSGVSGDFFDS